MLANLFFGLFASVVLSLNGVSVCIGTDYIKKIKKLFNKEIN